MICKAFQVWNVEMAAAATEASTNGNSHKSSSSSSSSSSRFTQILTWRTRRSFRLILHGCILTDCRTSLCNRIFSKICSFVDSWLLTPSPSDTTVLQIYVKSKYKKHWDIENITSKSNENLMIWTYDIEEALAQCEQFNTILGFVCGQMSKNSPEWQQQKKEKSEYIIWCLCLCLCLYQA